MTPEETLNYSDYVNNSAKNKTNEDFHNYGPEHARIVFPAIFNNSDKIIKILANNLCNSDVSGTDNYINSIDEFLDKKDTQLKILLSDISLEKFNASPQFLFFLYYHPGFKEGRVKIKKWIGENPIYETNQHMEGHFCVADNIMVREETDTKTRAAKCNFGNKEWAAKFDKIFDEAFDSSNADDLDLKNYIVFESSEK